MFIGVARIFCGGVHYQLMISDGATGGLGGRYPPLFENMGLVISPNLQTRAYGARERPPVSPDFRVPPTSKHLAPSLLMMHRQSVYIMPHRCEASPTSEMDIYIVFTHHKSNLLTMIAVGYQ